MSLGTESWSSFPKGPLLVWAEVKRQTEVHFPVIRLQWPGCVTRPLLVASAFFQDDSQPNMLPINLIGALFSHHVESDTARQSFKNKLFWCLSEFVENVCPTCIEFSIPTSHYWVRYFSSESSSESECKETNSDTFCFSELKRICPYRSN